MKAVAAAASCVFTWFGLILEVARWSKVARVVASLQGIAQRGEGGDEGCDSVVAEESNEGEEREATTRGKEEGGWGGGNGE